GIVLNAAGFAPRQGFAEMAELFAANVADHAAAAAANLQGEADFLEQAMYVDRLGAASVERLRRAASRAWAKALPSVLAEAQACSDADAGDSGAAAGGQRVRFGVYFYSPQGGRRWKRNPGTPGSAALASARRSRSPAAARASAAPAPAAPRSPRSARPRLRCA